MKPMKLRNLAVLAALPLALACNETPRTIGQTGVDAAPAPTIEEICNEKTCLELYYALSADVFGIGSKGFLGTGGDGLEELYESRERDSEDWMQSNLEDIRAGTFRSHHGIAGLSDPVEYVRLKAEYRREIDEKFRNDVATRLETTTALELAEEARQHVENIICRDEHGPPPPNAFYSFLKRKLKVAPGHQDAGAPLVSCADYTGPGREPFEVRDHLPGSYDEDLRAWLREREGGAK